jgi:hypothetical protein
VRPGSYRGSFRDLRGGTAGEIATAKELLDTRAIT